MRSIGMTIRTHPTLPDWSNTMTATAPENSQKRLTYEEYVRQFATEPPTLQPYYIADGVQIMLPMPGLRHQRVILHLLVLLSKGSEPQSTIVVPAPLDILIKREPLCTRQAEILVMSRERFDKHDVSSMPGPVTVAPEMVVEVLKTN